MLGPKHPLHQPLKSTWSIAQAEGHTVPLKEAKGGTEGRFWLIFFGNWDLIVPTVQVHRRKPPSTRESIKRLFNLS